MKRIILIQIYLLLLTFACNDQAEVKKIFYDNGKLKSEYHINANQRQGAFTLFYQNGNIKKTGNYKNNKLNGYIYSYFKNGDLKTISYWTRGINWGVTVVYYPEGKLHGFFLLNPKGEIMWRREYFPEGNLKLDEGNGLLTTVPQRKYKLDDTLKVSIVFAAPPDCDLKLYAQIDTKKEYLNFEDSVSKYGECYYSYNKILSDTGNFEIKFNLEQRSENDSVLNQFSSSCKYIVDI